MVDTAKAYHRYRAIRDGVVRDDPLYRAAIAASGGRSLVLPQKLECLFPFIRDELKTLDTQDIVEFGSFKGGSALFMAHLLRELYPQARLYACDTYEGMPETPPRMTCTGLAISPRVIFRDLSRAATNWG